MEIFSSFSLIHQAERKKVIDHSYGLGANALYNKEAKEYSTGIKRILVSMNSFYALFSYNLNVLVALQIIEITAKNKGTEQNGEKTTHGVKLFCLEVKINQKDQR